jgi:hypothetical protein
MGIKNDGVIIYEPDVSDTDESGYLAVYKTGV